MRIIIFFIMFVVVSSFVYADITFYPNTGIDHPNFVIKHGEQKTFETILTNTNLVCDIVCEYALLNANTQQTEDSKSITIKKNLPFTYKRTFNVPDYSSIHITYTGGFFLFSNPKI